MNLRLFLVTSLPFLATDAFFLPTSHTHTKWFSSLEEESTDVPEPNYSNLAAEKTIDVLDSNYPNLLEYLDTSIYNERMSFTSPQGVKFCNSLDVYSAFYESTRNAISMFFQNTSLIDHHISEDLEFSRITVDFKINLVPKLSRSIVSDLASSRNDHIVVAGISEYYLDLNGKIIKHVLAEIKIDTPLSPVPLTIPLRFGLSRNPTVEQFV